MISYQIENSQIVTASNLEKNMAKYDIYIKLYMKENPFAHLKGK
jgi:hypothetical protein